LLRETAFSSQSKSHGAIISIAEIPQEFSTAKINSTTRGIEKKKRMARRLLRKTSSA
jgi:hypothetical protein